MSNLPSQDQSKGIAILIFVLAIVLGGFLMGKQLLEFLNLIDTKEEKKEKKENQKIKDKVKNAENLPTSENYWKRGYWRDLADSATRQNKAIYLFKHDLAQAFASQLERNLSKSWFSELIGTEAFTEIYSIIKECKSKSQLSQLAGSYSNTYKRDLLTDMKSKLSEKQLAQIINYTEKMPSGIFTPNKKKIKL